MEYNGWALYDDVILVIKSEKYKYGKYEYPQAYVVNSNDKKQLNTALNWGRIKQYQYDENNMPIRDDNGYTKYITLEPTQVTLKNEGFTVELLDSAGNSTQGGKLSFWNCLISHGDIKCVVGINADILLDALLQNTFINGKCESKFSFARKSGNVGILSTNMVEYQEAVKDMQTKKSIGKGKTTKWQIGHNYKTLTIDELYLGKVYKPLDVKHESKNYDYRLGWQYEITLTERIDAQNHFTATVKDEFKSMKSYTDYVDYLYKSHKNSRYNSSDVIHHINNITSHGYISKLPSRQHGSIELSIDSSYLDYLEGYFNYVKQLVIDEIESDNGEAIYPYYLNDIIISTKPFTCDTLSDLDKKVIKAVLSKKNLDKCCKSQRDVIIKHNINLEEK